MKKMVYVHSQPILKYWGFLKKGVRYFNTHVLTIPIESPWELGEIFVCTGIKENKNHPEITKFTRD